jgi:predicted nucleic acid-binding protein
VPPTDTPQPAVLDTNVVLDWLLFGHPDGAAIAAAVTAGELRWIATSAMRDEFAHVLARGTLARWQPDAVALQARWAAHCDVVPAPVGPLDRPRCTDPDDQKFIDLAASRTGCLLLSRDRAVLKLARKLSALGVTLTTPTAWAAARALTSTSSC